LPKRCNGTVTVQANTPTTITLILGNSGNTPIRHNLQIPSNATISVYSINGERIFNHQNLAAGAYLLLVKDANGKSNTYKIMHSGGKLKIKTAAFAKQTATPSDWKITAVPTGFVYQSAEHFFNPVKGQNSEELITLPHTANSADWTPTAATFAIVEKPSVSIANSDVQNVNARNVALSWSLRPNVTKYEVYRDGVLLGETSGNLMEDYDLTIGQTYEYIVALRYENNATPYDLVIDLEKASVIREITVTTRIMGGSESPCQYTLSGSANGSSYTQLVNASSNGQPGFVVHSIDDANKYRYIKLSVSKFNDIRHNNANTVSWADGVYEVAVYGTQ